MEFIKILDIENNESYYPDDPNYLMLFETKELQYFLYMITTKEAVDQINIIQVSGDTYKELKNKFGEDIGEILLESIEELPLFLRICRTKVALDNITLGEMFNLK